jgi:hypothetical protein
MNSKSRNVAFFLAVAIVCLGIAAQVIRIAQVQSPTGETPFHSANDRSRWCTIAALAIEGRYEIDNLLEIRQPPKNRRTWYTIDLVRHRGKDGELHYYSSKPPLLPTMYTGVYLAVRQITGATLMKQTFFVARIMLLLVNLIPLVALWVVMTRKALREHESNTWAICVLAVFIAFGTFLSTFSNTLNNHLPAAVAAGISLWCLDRIIQRGQRQWYWFALCGLCTSFTAANEMPALSWLAIVAGLLLLIDARRTLYFYVPALLPVALAFFVTNYITHGVWRPAYTHRDLGAKLFELPVENGTSLTSLAVEKVVAACQENKLNVSPTSVIRPARRSDVYELWDEAGQQRLGLRLDQPDRLGVYQWDDWYDYPGSYWVNDRKMGVDRGEASKLIYAFHCLLGHHGIFSLTPFWFLAICGAVVGCRRYEKNLFASPQLLLVVAIVVTSLVCTAFYLARPLEDRNYGGVCSGLRWVFWMTPLWFWLACDGLKAVKHFAWRRLVELTLLVSVVSANYPWSNPWTAPWLMQLWEHWGWINYH